MEHSPSTNELIRELATSLGLSTESVAKWLVGEDAGTVARRLIGCLADPRARAALAKIEMASADQNREESHCARLLKGRG